MAEQERQDETQEKDQSPQEQMTEQPKEEEIPQTEEAAEESAEGTDGADGEEAGGGMAGDGSESGAEQGDAPQESTSQEDAPEGETAQTWAEKRAAKKQAKLDKKADAARDKVNELEDKVRRQLAEFENFRKRSEKEKQVMFETGARSVIEKILPVIDNFERGLATVPEDQREEPFVDGVSRIYKQFLTELEKIGVKPIEAVGKEFDPALHNAVMQVESDQYEPGIVAQELQKGYTYRDSVVRHSMVAVAK